MSKEQDTREKSAAPVVLDAEKLRDNAIRSLQDGSIAAVLVVNNMDGVRIGRDGYMVDVMPGCDYIVLAVSRSWPDLGERIAVPRLTQRIEEIEDGVQPEPTTN